MDVEQTPTQPPPKATTDHTNEHPPHHPAAVSTDKNTIEEAAHLR